MQVLFQARVAPDTEFTVLRADLLQQPVDAIVNAANGMLAHGGGVAGIISRAAGPDLQAESDGIVAARGALPAGTAVVTAAGRLPFKGVIHAVGPRQGEGNEQAKLESALDAAFARARERGWTSVALPAVSAGIFAVPPAVCARAYAAAVKRSGLRKVVLCLRDQPVIDAVLEELKQ